MPRALPMLGLVLRVRRWLSSVGMMTVVRLRGHACRWWWFPGPRLFKLRRTR